MIKNYIKILVVSASIFVGITVNAQSYISDFEINIDGNGDAIVLDSNGVWVGDSIGHGFENGAANYISDYNPSWGGYWAGGFSVTNNVDDTTAGYLNNYSTFADSVWSGNQFSTVSAGAYANASLSLDSAQTVQGFYISNTTYAALSMKNGDYFAKMFGDTLDANGAIDSTFGADWFKLTITPMHGDSLYLADAVDYYLADYRFADNTQDYILNTWEWVSLASFGDVDALKFILSSSDVGSSGMNTPSYFSMDDLVIGDPLVGNVELLEKLVSIYPNPANNVLNVKIPSDNFKITILDNVGRIVKTSNKKTINISDLNSGMYIVSVEFDGFNKVEKLIIK